MSASALSSLPGAFRSLIGAVSAALQPTASRCDPPPCHSRQRIRCDVADRCGLLLNEALHEIYRLRSGLAGGPATTTTSVQPCNPLSPSDEALRVLASPLPDRRPYAVPALGDVQAIAREPVPVIQPEAIVQRRIVTNLGTLLDVLM